MADEDADGETVTLEFRAYGDDERVDGTVTIESRRHGYGQGDITYKVDPDDSVDFDRADFKEYFDDEFDGDDTFRYVVFYADSSSQVLQPAGCITTTTARTKRNSPSPIWRIMNSTTSPRTTSSMI